MHFELMSDGKLYCYNDDSDDGEKLKGFLLSHDGVWHFQTYTGVMLTTNDCQMIAEKLADFEAHIVNPTPRPA